MKIYTRRGDDGTTGLFAGSAVGKESSRIEVLGDLDELNSVIGTALSFGAEPTVADDLARIQRDLFRLGAEVASLDPVRAGTATLSESDVERLEREIDRREEELEPLRAFILPGGSPGGAMLHLARSVARRAERSLVALAGEVRRASSDPAAGAPIRPVTLAYLNRLADHLFVAARRQNLADGRDETRWLPGSETNG